MAYFCVCLNSLTWMQWSAQCLRSSEIIVTKQLCNSCDSHTCHRVCRIEKYFHRQPWEWLADVDSNSWFFIGVCEEPVCFYCLWSSILTLGYVTSGLKCNQTGKTAGWSLETRRPELNLSMLYLTRSPRPLDSELSGWSKNCDKQSLHENTTAVLFARSLSR